MHSSSHTYVGISFYCAHSLSLSLRFCDIDDSSLEDNMQEWAGLWANGLSASDDESEGERRAHDE